MLQIQFDGLTARLDDISLGTVQDSESRCKLWNVLEAFVASCHTYGTPIYIPQALRVSLTRVSLEGPPYHPSQREWTGFHPPAKRETKISQQGRWTARPQDGKRKNNDKSTKDGRGHGSQSKLQSRADLLLAQAREWLRRNP